MKKWLVVLAMLVVSGNVALADEKLDLIRTSLKKIIPDMQPELISKTPIAGIYEVKYGTEIYYASADGQFLIRGEVLDIARKRNLTEESRSVARRQLMESLDRNSMIVFSPKKIKHHMTVFTDVDCGYCRKLHQEIDELNGYGVEVRYLLFPRAGIDSQSATKAQSVWCSDDRKEALTDAKLGKKLAEKSCANPIVKNIELADKVGITGTPTIILDSGEIISGYVAAAKLKEILEVGETM